MFRVEELEAFAGPMSNYSVYFLSQNAHLYTNCSVYSLISGSIMAQDFDSQLWRNDSADFLPAYYVTNCSISNLVQQIRNQNSTADDVAAWLDDYYINPYNVADNGDSFVALLYMLSGSCVSCWMLVFLILLSPKHKRKPLLTQLAMLVYSSVLTAILVKVTQVTREEYYADSLDMVRLLSLTVEKQFTISLAISELVTNLAYLQLILKLSRHKWRKFNLWFVSFLAVACLVAYSILISRIDAPEAFVTTTFDTSKSGHISLRIVFMTWFAGNLGYYTVCGTSTAPREVSYSRKLLPLAFITWFSVCLYLIVCILMLALWNDVWLINVWISFLPTLSEMYILVASWEWLHSIRHVEQRLELRDVLGRRISVDDVKAFNNDKNVRTSHSRSRFSSFINFLTGKNDCGTASLNFSASDARSLMSEYRTSLTGSRRGFDGSDAVPRGNGFDELRDDASHQEVLMDNADLWEVSEDEHGSGSAGHGTGPQAATHEEAHEPIMQVGTSSRAEVEELPSFTPHPGYNMDDYWEDKR